MKVGILGFGEIGKAIYRLYSECDEIYVQDLKCHFGNPENLEVLNVCIPWSDEFIENVSIAIEKLDPGLVIIHSTVKPGTTKQLYEKYGNVVHSPVRGVHPNLVEGLKTFTKYIGADDATLSRKAYNHLFFGMKLKSIVYDYVKQTGDNSIGDVHFERYYIPSIATELAKILSTTYYGLCIAFHGEAKKLCDKYDVDFDLVMTGFNKSYNDGYAKLGMKNVVRPILYPPDKIGGHCIVPNVKLLDGMDEIVKLILKYEEKQ